MRKKSKFKQLSVKSLVLFSLLAATVPVHTYADGTQVTAEPVFDVPSVGSVWVNDKSYFELKDARLSVGADNNMVTFTVKIVNGGTSDILFIDYWVRMQSIAGANFTINVMPQDKDKNVIPAGGTQEIKFYANVTSAIQLKDLQFKIIKWDFSSAEYQKTLGILQIPDNYTTVAPAGSKANIKISKTSLQGFIKRATISSNEENFLPSIILELQNTDIRSLKLPTMNYMIRTSDGLLYPLTASGVTNTTTIDPLMKKEITLTGKLPRSISDQNWELVITENTTTGETTSVNTAFAEFKIPNPTEDTSATEKEQSFSNESGTYVATLESIQRVPWEDDDLLSASILLKSKESKPLSIPNLTGYIELDDSVKVEVKVIRTDNVIGLQPDKEVRIQLLGTIPYTYEYSKMTVHLQESVKSGSGTNNTTVTDLVAFKVDSAVDSVPVVKADDRYKLGGLGRLADYYIHALHNISGKSSDLITAQVEIENLEKRSNDLSKLVAHFKGADGTVYPATITEIKTKISPSGKALVHIWANVAKSKSPEITQLLIGEGITQGKYSLVSEKPDSYVNAVAFDLPKEKAFTPDTIKDIDIFPYKLSLSRVGTSVNKTEIKVAFDYELEKNNQYEVNTEEYKLNIELEDLDGKARMDWNLVTEKEADGKTTGATTLQIGKNKMELTKTDNDFIFKTSFLKKYKLNLYVVFQGQKRLVASKQLDWFYFSD
ncbi:hypothetical protein FE783_23230 [Paenibacillus mesophilus]|uniref:hypothetical protein n=1 Tax=Paenibacillus mesophilus TaxID=2582849 RepID=UPI00110EDE6A|nr:hypothetical protein [Paenibacillus mesophilus]TMV47160.1 hypothetical protein FE783_23230 [Paenibacillus mesophilus]